LLPSDSGSCCLLTREAAGHRTDASSIGSGAEGAVAAPGACVAGTLFVAACIGSAPAVTTGGASDAGLDGPQCPAIQTACGSICSTTVLTTVYDQASTAQTWDFVLRGFGVAAFGAGAYLVVTSAPIRRTLAPRGASLPWSDAAGAVLRCSALSEGGFARS
jgi:hypothetical protein